MSLQVNRSLLNPKFEGYKLKLSAHDEEIAHHELDYKPSPHIVSANHTLSFQEMQSRVTHNHLAVARDASRALYVSSDYKVVLIDVSLDTFQPTFHIVYELPKPLWSPESDALINPEYCSATFLTSSVALVADGHGSLYFLYISDELSAQIVGPFELSLPTMKSIPFRIHNAFMGGPSHAIAVLSSRNYDSMEVDVAGTKHPKKSTLFDVWAVRFTWPLTSVQPMDVIWRRQGEDVPTFVSHDASRGAHLLVGSSVYEDLLYSQKATPYVPAPDEMAPIPRQGENLDNSQVDSEFKPPPYLWTQTSETVSVAFPLPSNTSKNNIAVTFSAQSLSLHIHHELPTTIRLPGYSAKTLWDTISPSSSYWTWDRDAEHSFGLLTLHLDKQHEGRKWMHVFAVAGTQASSEASPEDIDVPETLDPSELWQIRESLEKYTSALREGTDASGLGLGAGIPSLAEGELDSEVDTSVGREEFLSWILDDGSMPSWASKTDTPYTILSTPLPGTESLGPSLVIKSTLDGAFFTLEQTDSAPKWTHSSTYSALAFVLASKRDTRFTYHIPSKAVLSFDSNIRNMGGNLYAYHGHSGREMHAKQSILRFIGVRSGTLLGVGAFLTAEGKTVILGLSENQLTLIRGLL